MSTTPFHKTFVSAKVSINVKYDFQRLKMLIKYSVQFPPMEFILNPALIDMHRYSDLHKIYFLHSKVGC